ncbi:septum site-determining protein MinC [Paenibacillus yanchengensis]|uniref:Probable septum site-determining protein MinC n=1 Tax=Paenibacillus yanchengensis TaxID=2035833 RepID=A0ABW4YLE9_9BACL
MTEKQYIVIKGVKEGLLFLLDDECSYSELLHELEYKLQKTHSQLLSGPLIHVNVKLGKRLLSEQEKEHIRAIIRKQGNLIIQSIDSDLDEMTTGGRKLQVVSMIVRSGQTIDFDGDLMLLGDVNPGGSIICTGNIYVMGALRGAAHAGSNGRTDVIIAASLMRPTQLKIADVFSKRLDEWATADAAMEFAYWSDGEMKIDKMTQLFRMQQQSILFRGV